MNVICVIENLQTSPTLNVTKRRMHGGDLTNVILVKKGLDAEETSCVTKKHTEQKLYEC